MVLTNRYFVLKGTDVFNSLTPEEISQLTALCEKINKHREQRGAAELSGVFIEADWPEFDTTVELLEKRINEVGYSVKVDTSQLMTNPKFTDRELLAAMNIDISLSTESEYRQGMMTILETLQLTPGEKATLSAAYEEGPLEDGNVLSKTDRDSLVSLGMMVRIANKEKGSLNACTHKGHSAYLLIMYTTGRW